MSIKVELNEKILNGNEQLRMHFLPAKIDGDGKANVDDYFENYTQKQNGHLTNAFRGFPLMGEEVNVPKHYKAVVLQETSKPLNETAERTLRLSGSFTKFTYWNYDKVPSKDDPYKQAMQMRIVAEELARPITANEFEEQLKRVKRKQQTEEI